MNKNIIKTIAFILTVGALPAELLYANPIANPPVGEVTHKYEDAHGRHDVRYEAYPKDTLKKLRYLRNGNRVLGLAGLAGGAVLATGTAVFVFAEGALSIKSGVKMEEIIETAAVFTGIAVIAGALGVRSLSHAQKAARMLERHVPQPMFSQKSLENPALKNSALEWFLKSKETKPIQEQITTNPFPTVENK